MKAFWLPATEFPSLQKEMRRQRYCGCFFSFSFTKRHNCQSVSLTLPLSSPPPYLSTLLMNERMNEKKNEGNKRKEQANRLAFFIPAWFRRWPFHASLDSQVCGADEMRKIKEEEERVEMEPNLVKMTPLENSEGVRVGCLLGTKIHVTFGLNFVLICILVSLQ
jgi:hypothetical protein